MRARSDTCGGGKYVKLRVNEHVAPDASGSTVPADGRPSAPAVSIPVFMYFCQYKNRPVLIGFWEISGGGGALRGHAVPNRHRCVND